MRWILAVALAASAAAIGHAAKVGTLFPQPFGILQWEKPPYTDEFKSRVSEGMAALKRGDVDRGIELLTEAAKTRLSSVHAGDEPPPNFELWDDIALAECKRSDRRKALSLLKDYKCAVDMTVHETSCYVGEFGAEVPNAQLTPLCFRTMCGEVWGPGSKRMGGASSDDPDGIAMSLNELRRVDRLLKQCALPKTVVR